MGFGRSSDLFVRYGISLDGTNIKAATASVCLGGEDAVSRSANVSSNSLRSAGLAFQRGERDHAHLLDGHLFCFLNELLLEVFTCVSDDEAIVMLHQFAFPEKHRCTAEHRPPESESLGKQVLEDIEALRPDLGANKNLIVTHVHLLCCWLRTIC